ncbi:MAG: hypothetical protein RLZZ205_182, partial [Bacteroidota bacterium]
MNLADQINEDIKTAMKGGDKEKLMALRDIKSKILLEATKDGSSEVTDDKVMSILTKLNKQRMESIEIFKAQGREDLVEEEQKQAAVIQAYLPQPMSAEELEKTVKEIIAQVGASGPGDMGKVMGVASKSLTGKADGKAISEMV